MMGDSRFRRRLYERLPDARRGPRVAVPKEARMFGEQAVVETGEGAEDAGQGRHLAGATGRDSR